MPATQISDAGDSDAGDSDAGDFASWLNGAQRAIRGEATSDVPCGACTACCTSSQFIHIRPDETATLARIPQALLFPAPLLPKGHVLMGYDQHGHCPMFVDGGCSIYEDRPTTCRTYDCRVFPAAGLQPDDDKVLIAAQAVRWSFTYATDADRVNHDAVRAAATFVNNHRDDLAEELRPHNATQLAVCAIELHDVFVNAEPTPSTVRVELTRRAAERNRS